MGDLKKSVNCRIMYLLNFDRVLLKLSPELLVCFMFWKIINNLCFSGNSLVSNKSFFSLWVPLKIETIFRNVKNIRYDRMFIFPLDFFWVFLIDFRICFLWRVKIEILEAFDVPRCPVGIAQAFTILP